MKQIIKITKKIINIHSVKKINNNLKSNHVPAVSRQALLSPEVKVPFLDSKKNYIYHPDVKIYEELKTLQYIHKN
jgi:hypothetical protein